MRNFFIILILALLQPSCTSDLGKSDKGYIKVITLGNPDSLSAYNRGLSLGNYMHWDMHKDSIVFRDYADTLFAFSASSIQGLKDTLENFITFLKGRPNGDVDTSASSVMGVYCGPVFYLEMRDAKGLHYYTFMLGGNDTLSSFSECFFQMHQVPAEKKSFNALNINPDSFAVNMMKDFGYYEEIPIPYVGVYCDPTIDHSKIFGVWRTLSTRLNTDSNTYDKLTFKKNGILLYERRTKGLLRFTLKMKFQLADKDSVLILNSGGYKREYNIIKLTENCFEYNDGGTIYKYNSIKVASD